MADENLFDPTAQVKQAVQAPQTLDPSTASMVGSTPAASEGATKKAEQSLFDATPPGVQTMAAPSAGSKPSSATKPFELGTKSFEPILSNVDQKTETVAGQLEGLFDKGNPLMVQARNRAAAQAAGRGMQNTSLAVGAGQLAQMNAALPIAQQDAATYTQRAMSNNQIANQYRLNEQSAQIQLNQLREQGNVQAYLQELNAFYERDLAVLNGNISKDIKLLEGAQRLQQIAAEGDQSARLQLQKYGFDLNLSAQDNLNRLSQIAAQGDVNAKLQLQQFNFDSMMADVNAGHALTLEDARFQNSQNLLVKEYEQRGVLSGQEAQQEMQRLNQQHANTLEQIAAQATVADKDRAAQLQAQYLAAVAARQSSASAEITDIYTTPKLSATQQNTGVRNVYTRMQQDLDLLSSYYQQSPLWPGDYAPTAPAAAPTTPTTVGEGAGGATLPGGMMATPTTTGRRSRTGR